MVRESTNESVRLKEGEGGEVIFKMETVAG